MKVRPSVKPICEKCKIIKRKGRVIENTRGAAGASPYPEEHFLRADIDTYPF